MTISEETWVAALRDLGDERQAQQERAERAEEAATHHAELTAAWRERAERAEARVVVTNNALKDARRVITLLEARVAALDELRQSENEESNARLQAAEARVAELEAERDDFAQRLLRRSLVANAEKAQALRFRDEGNAWKIDLDAALDLLREYHSVRTLNEAGEWERKVDAFLSRRDRAPS